MGQDCPKAPLTNEKATGGYTSLPVCLEKKSQEPSCPHMLLTQPCVYRSPIRPLACQRKMYVPQPAQQRAPGCRIDMPQNSIWHEHTIGDSKLALAVGQVENLDICAPSRCSAFAASASVPPSVRVWNVLHHIVRQGPIAMSAGIQQGNRELLVSVALCLGFRFTSSRVASPSLLR